MLEQLSGGDEQVKLIDFGIAKVVNPQAGNETEIAVVAGSRQYIAPEQLLSQTASPATDIYALAIIVYEMVTGRLPFNPQGATHFLVMQELMRLQRNEIFDEPQTLRPDLPAPAQMLLLNALSFDARRRPQNARIFAEDLAQALTGKIKVGAERATIAIPAPIGGPEAPPARDMTANPSRETLPMTQAKTEENPAKTTDAIPAARPSAPHFMPSETAPIAPARVTSVNSKGGKLPITLSIIIGGLIVVIVAARIAVKTLAPSPQSNSTPAAALSPTP